MMANAAVRGYARSTNVEKTNAIRTLDASHMSYTVYTYPPEAHSAAGIGALLGVRIHQVHKTLVVLRPPGRPMLVMLAGDRQLDPRLTARSVAARKVHVASHREAERMAGLKLGGISALVNSGFDAFLDATAVHHETILVSAGKRGVNLRLSVADLLRVTKACVIEASLPGSSPREDPGL